MDLAQDKEFHAEVEQLMSDFHVPGFSFAFRHNDQTYSKGFGYARNSTDSQDAALPCTEETLFDIASASKSLTGAAVALLVADDEKYPEIKWDTPLSSLLGDDFAMPGEGYTESVTIEDVLSHRTGLASHDASYLGIKAAQPDDARSVTRNVQNLSVLAPIRTTYVYCNLMFTVATYLIEKKTGLSFSDFLEQKFFEPLGMTSTSLQPERAKAKGFGDRIASGYEWIEKGSHYVEMPALETQEDQGAGSIITSVNDYLKWVTAIMEKQSPITESIYKDLLRSRSFQNPEMENLAPFASPVLYAVGLEVYYYRGYQIVLHDGMIDGFASRLFFLPHFKFGGAIFGNSGGAGDVSEIIFYRLVDKLLEVPPTSKVDWVKFMLDRNVRYEETQEEWRKEQRDKLLSGLAEPEPQKMPLSAYVGEYWNVGYHALKVQIKDDQLFVDATDRSFQFTLRFEHIRDQTKYIAHLEGIPGGDTEPCRAEFRFDDKNQAVKLGVLFETDIEEYIWFDRTIKSS